MILYIDTTDFNKVTFALTPSSPPPLRGRKNTVSPPWRGGVRVGWKKSYQIDPHKVYETLAILEKFLKSAKVKLPQIKKIITNKGPGSFTGTRVGVTHTLALGFAWEIPVKFLAKDKFEKLRI